MNNYLKYLTLSTCMVIGYINSNTEAVQSINAEAFLRNILIPLKMEWTLNGPTVNCQNIKRNETEYNNMQQAMHNLIDAIYKLPPDIDLLNLTYQPQIKNIFDLAHNAYEIMKNQSNFLQSHLNMNILLKC